MVVPQGSVASVEGKITQCLCFLGSISVYSPVERGRSELVLILLKRFLAWLLFSSGFCKRLLDIFFPLPLSLEYRVANWGQLSLDPWVFLRSSFSSLSIRIGTSVPARLVLKVRSEWGWFAPCSLLLLFSAAPLCFFFLLVFFVCFWNTLIGVKLETDMIVAILSCCYQLLAKRTDILHFKSLNPAAMDGTLKHLCGVSAPSFPLVLMDVFWMWKSCGFTGKVHSVS